MPRPPRPPRSRVLGLQMTFEYFDFGGGGGVYSDQVLVLADRVQDGGMVSPSEPAADLGERAQRQGLGQIHGDLPRTYHVGGPPRRQQVAAADIVVARDDALDFL